MLTLVSEDIERYAIDHTTPLPDYLQELTDYTYENMSIPQMLSGPIEGTFLQTLVWATGAKRVLEIGTFTGFSSQMMAAALPEDGVLVTCDIDPEAAEVAERVLCQESPRPQDRPPARPALGDPGDPQRLGLRCCLHRRRQDRLSRYYEKAVDLLAPRGVIAVDNVLWGGRVLDPKTEEDRAIAAFNERVKADPACATSSCPSVTASCSSGGHRSVSETNDYAVLAEGLVRNFGDVRAVDGIDLAVRRGEIYGFLGPNGAGKTTVVRMLITLLMPHGGRAMVAGKDVVREPKDVRLRVGAALQEAALDPKQTGREILRLQGWLFGMSGREVDRRLVELESLMDIGDAINRFVGTYSGGMKRRLDLAAALIHDPEVLFLDEPTTGLDPISRNRVWEEVRRINKELGVTIFLTTQYLEEADILAERVGIIDRSKIAVEGSPAELKRSVGKDVIIVQIEGDSSTAVAALENIAGVSQVEDHGQELVVSVENGAALVGNVALALDRSGLKVGEITLRTPTLDDVFLTVTGGRIQVDADPTEEE